MYWYDHGMNGWGYAFMVLNSIVFWALLVGAGVLLYRVIRRSGPQQGTGTSGQPPAEQILAERYARGEIDDEEYRQRLDTLRRPSS
jgi:putative membrane protein